ncbi:putative protein kinase RLK-Pelle-LRR-XI-1 family [Medicago truncatula]|uniref:LRR receptor-like kinase family protein n=2 Tax=Medicago truncatula TaxID=3880 RepID=A0A072UDL5_MEDTR|nr:LRR receptor-like kinase family protein [Medicago truncatula]RHN53029.1 putative protein kinase RLK-Pelle-LRR-XI-1 family [Medicago truncatula]
MSILLFIFFFIYANCESQLYNQEHEILLSIKNHFQNPSFLSHWTKSNTSSHCLWPEILCTKNSVTSLSMINKNITQTIPLFLCELKNLTYIDFQYNYIPNEFPTSLYNCSKIEHLDLSDNFFVGNIPNDIDRLASLQFLSLGANNFSGDIPMSIGKLRNLKSLRLYECLFNGSIANEIGDLLNLETLSMFSNSMLPRTKLPSSFTKLKNLRMFHMYDSNLFGEIPVTIGEMMALEYLDLSGNFLSGKIPNGLFMLKNLSIVYLYRNSLFGEIPSLVEALNLTEIDLSENNLAGKIPNDFGKLQSLTWLYLYMNNLSGEIPHGIGNLKSLKGFYAFINKFSGTLPSDFGLHSKLEYFRIEVNNFKGKLPENFCYHGNLQVFTAYENHLSGELPKSIGNCSNLLVLEIYKNEFSGKIPSGLWNMNLVIFMISHNKFNGEIPQNLSSSISVFDISYNQFYGGIPIGVSSWTSVVEFIASKNYLNGSIPQELTTLPNLERLLLDQNQLKGSLPSDVISWKSLATLNLSQNQLNGQIPISIGHLPSLSVLDLSENQFSGEIPPILTHLRNLNLNLSSNHLTGRVPTEFENSAYDRSFLNNSDLCVDTQALNLTHCKSGLKKHWFLGLIISLIVVTLLFVLLALFKIIKRYRKREPTLENSWELISFQRLSFTESTIVSSMTEQNIIGSGGFGTVYRVPVDGLTYVAVKKIKSNKNSRQQLEASFRAEVKILSNIRHRNIVKLLCCISNEDSMMLVYEYLEHSSLDKWLHNKNESLAMLDSAQHVVLDWPKRLRIATGIAHGLCYMHHDCSPPIIHRDIKTSNILLDSEFNAKVADFGFARFLTKPGQFNTMSALVGSFGYMAPEYVQTTRVNEKIDVFSFGVILLELTTGKKATRGDEYSSLAQWAWRHIQAESNIIELLDNEVMEQSCLDEMCCIFKLGIMCTATRPSSRPSMKKVLHTLLRSEVGIVFGQRNDIAGEYDIVPFH